MGEDLRKYMPHNSTILRETDPSAMTPAASVGGERPVRKPAAKGDREKAQRRRQVLVGIAAVMAVVAPTTLGIVMASRHAQKALDARAHATSIALPAPSTTTTACVVPSTSSAAQAAPSTTAAASPSATPSTKADGRPSPMTPRQSVKARNESEAPHDGSSPVPPKTAEPAPPAPSTTAPSTLFNPTPPF